MTRQHAAFWFPLEQCGPDGNYYVPTSNRAELRAATAALECRNWHREGWTQVTIATDSTYVVDGITNWVVRWQERDWRKPSGEEVANSDLWIRLLGLLNYHASEGCEVQFLHIGRHLNNVADFYAKEAAATEGKSIRYQVRNLTNIEQK